jgi:hypothetical protein
MGSALHAPEVTMMDNETEQNQVAQDAKRPFV